MRRPNRWRRVILLLVTCHLSLLTVPSTKAEAVRLFDKFSKLLDVQVTSPTEGQVPRFNATSGKWENAAIPGAPFTFNRIAFGPDNPLPGDTLPDGYNYAAQTTDLTTVGSANAYVTLPDASLVPPGTIILIADESGTATEFNSILVSSPSQFLGVEWLYSNGIFHRYGCLLLTSNGTKWMQIDTLSSDSTTSFLHANGVLLPNSTLRENGSANFGPNGEVDIQTDGTLTAITFQGNGSALTLDASGFDGNLTTSDDTLQAVAQKVDDLTVSGVVDGQQIFDSSHVLAFSAANENVNAMPASFPNGVEFGTNGAAYFGGPGNDNLHVTEFYPHDINMDTGGGILYSPETSSVKTINGVDETLCIYPFARKLFDSSATIAFDFATVGLSVDWQNRKLYASDGTTVNADYNNPAGIISKAITIGTNSIPLWGNIAGGANGESFISYHDTDNGDPDYNAIAVGTFDAPDTNGSELISETRLDDATFKARHWLSSSITSAFSLTAKSDYARFLLDGPTGQTEPLQQWSINHVPVASIDAAGNMVANSFSVDASGFNGNLTTSDDTLQEVAQKLDDLSVSGASDTAFASSWNGVTTIAPSKNAVYDWGHLFDTDDDGKVNLLDNVSTAGLVVVDATGLVTGTASRVGTVTAVFDGNGSALTTGNTGIPFTVPYAGTITGWSISVDAGTATFKVWENVNGTAIPTISDVINSSGVAISTGTHVRSSTTSDFSAGLGTTVTAGNQFVVALTAVATATKAVLEVEITK